MNLRRLTRLGLISISSLIAANSTMANEVADFYKDKRITMWIGYSSGGGYDRYARTLARHMGKHIPGNPKFVSKNKTGAGSMILTNEVYSTLPQDGTVVAAVGRGLVMEPLYGNKQAKFDPRKFGWLGSTNNEVSVCATMSSTGIKSYDDLKTRGATLGGTGKGADTDTFPTVLNNVMGTRLKLVTGYPGGNDINFAMEKGELDGRCGWSWSSVKATRAAWLKSGKINILVQLSTSKHPDLPNVPLILDLAKSEMDKKILNMVFAPAAWGRPINTTPNVPKARLAALQAAFDATMKDPKYIAEMKRQKLELNPISGKQIQSMIEDIYQTPKDLVAKVAKAAGDDSAINVSKASIPILTHQGKITQLKRKGRRISWKGPNAKGKLRVRGKTKITIAGEKVKSSALKVGMSCTFKVRGVESALEVACN
ncbi:MAG: tripartite tricarboxylate transporter substrate-binding protein [Rhodospirillaceae bacterium]